MDALDARLSQNIGKPVTLELVRYSPTFANHIRKGKLVAFDATSITILESTKEYEYTDHSVISFFKTSLVSVRIDSDRSREFNNNRR